MKKNLYFKHHGCCTRLCRKHDSTFFICRCDDVDDTYTIRLYVAWMLFLSKVPYSVSSFSTQHNEEPDPQSALTAVLYHMFPIHYTQNRITF